MREKDLKGSNGCSKSQTIGLGNSVSREQVGGRHHVKHCREMPTWDLSRWISSV